MHIDFISFSFFVPTEVYKIYLYFAYVNVWQQLCDVRVYVECNYGTYISHYFFFYAEVIAAQVCIVKMSVVCPPFQYFTLCILTDFAV